MPALSTSDSTLSHAALVRGILCEKELMPRRYQNPKLEKRKDVERPFYFVRVIVPRLTAEGKKRKREVMFIGYTDEIGQKDAEKRRSKILEVVNAGRFLAQSQLLFKDVAQQFLDLRIPQLGVATQNKYRTQITNHLLPTFGKMQLHEIDAVSIQAWLKEKEDAGLGWWSRIDLKGVMSAIFTTAKQ